MQRHSSLVIRHSSLDTRHFPLCIVHCAFCIVVAAASAAAATYTWQNTDGTGVLNTPDNWSPALAPLVSGDKYTLSLTGGDSLRLAGDFTASTLLLSGGAEDGAPALVDLGGHVLCTTSFSNNGYFDIATPNPVVFRNGAIDTKYYLRLGVNGSPDLPVSLAFDNAVLGAVPNHTRYARRLDVAFSDCVVTNFPFNNPASNTYMEFDNTHYALVSPAAHFSARAAATNVTMRFLNGTTFARYDTRFIFGYGFMVTNCNYSFESGCDPEYQFSLAGARNALAFTNATMKGQLNVTADDTPVNFHDACISNYPASGNLVNVFGGKRNVLTLTGGTRTFVQYLDFRGTDGLFHIERGVQATNRFGNLRFNWNGRGNALVVEPGAAFGGLPSAEKFITVMTVENPACSAAFTNATMFGSWAVTGDGFRLNFHDSTISNKPPSGYKVCSMNGNNGLLSFTGPEARIWVNYIDFGGTNTTVSFADNIVATNDYFLFRASAKGIDCKVLIGTNAQVTIKRFLFDYNMRNTNLLVRVGRGSRLYSRDSYTSATGPIGGIGSRLVLDNSEYFSEGTSGGEGIGYGGTIELLGDDARFIASNSRGAMGYIHFGIPIPGDPTPTTMLFRPGATGYHGVAPVRLYSHNFSYIQPTVVFDVDATAFARGKPAGTYDIPLIRKGGLCKYSGITTDLDALNAIGVFKPANGALAVNDDGDLVFRFKRDLGTRLILK